MRTAVLYACALLLLTACQKEVFMPPDANPSEAPGVLPGPQTDTEPADDPESVYLRNLVYVLNSEIEYKLTKLYTDDTDLWKGTPDWVKDDIHLFHDMGDGLITSPSKHCPENPFKSMTQRWTTYGDEIGVRLTWVDKNYKPTTYVLLHAVPGKWFKAYHFENGVKIYSVFTAIEK